MKFGKRLESVVGMYDVEWNLFWIDYSGLKNLLVPESDSTTKTEAVTENRDLKQLAHDPQEVEFFVKVGSEIKKVSEFYQIIETQFSVRLQRVRWSFDVITSRIDDTRSNKDLERLMIACNRLHRDLLMLESYCLMNYSGFSKILKKHDKLTGYITRDLFMRSKVNRQPFVKPQLLFSMISDSESIFNQVKQLYEISQAKANEEDQFVEAMLSLKQSMNDDDDVKHDDDDDTDDVFDECLKATRKEKP